MSIRPCFISILRAVVVMHGLVFCPVVLGEDMKNCSNMDIESANSTLLYSLYPVSQRSIVGSNDSAPQQFELSKWQLAEAPADPSADPAGLQWTDVTMPASIVYALYRAGKLENPWFAGNHKEMQWIRDRDWILRTTFTIPQNWDGKAIRLRFDGMDYLGSVWLDDKYLGSHAGMFGGPTVDITDMVRPGSSHTLTVRLLQGMDQFAVMKSHAVHGNTYVWGNKFRNSGLWQPVRLVATGTSYLEAPNVRTESIADKSAELFAQAMVVNTTRPFTGTVHAKIIDLTSNKIVWEEDYEQAVPRGTSFWEQSITLKNPRLWWPNGMGDQSLYRLELKLSNVGKPMDSITSRFGIRTLEMRRNPYILSKPRSNPKRMDVWSLDVKSPAELGNSVEWGRPDLWLADNPVDDDALHNSDESYRYLFVVNGRPLFGKGVCWMTADDVLALDAEREDWMVRAAKNAGVNIFRLNGGNCLFETDRFYNRCDENGILVWQDLPLCWHRAITVPLTVWREQIKQSVLRIRQHPSLAVYVGGNEFSPYALGLINYMGVAREITASYDNRPFRMNSPSAGNHHSYFAHGLFNEQAFLDLWIGDPNSYIRDFGENVNFVGEWSLMSFTNYSEMKRIAPEGELDDQPVGYDCKKFTESHATLYDRFVEVDRISGIFWNRPSYFGDLGKATIPEMVEYSQMAHAETYGYVFENWRAQFPYKGGQTVWTYNSHSPVTGWAIIDWFGQPKLAYYSIKRAHELIHVYANTGFLSWGAGDTFSAQIGAINDHPKPLKNAKMEARVLDGQMNEVARENWVIDVPADGYSSDKGIISWQIPANAPAQFFFLEVTLSGSDGKQLSRNVYCPRVLDFLADPVQRTKWKSTPAATELTQTGPWLRSQMENVPTTISAKLIGVSESEKEAQVKARIKNTGKYPAYPVRLMLTPDTCSVLWSDNYFWLKPGETRDIEGIVRLDMSRIDPVTSPVRMKLQDITLAVSAWNTSEAAECRLRK